MREPNPNSLTMRRWRIELYKQPGLRVLPPSLFRLTEQEIDVVFGYFRSGYYLGRCYTTDHQMFSLENGKAYRIDFIL